MEIRAGATVVPLDSSCGAVGSKSSGETAVFCEQCGVCHEADNYPRHPRDGGADCAGDAGEGVKKRWVSTMAKYDSCENCGKLRMEGELLSAVDCWTVSQWDGRRRLSYWLVCENCYDTRQQWCPDVFPDYCEKCGSKIPDGEHYIEKDENRDGNKLVSHGLAPDETCSILCEDCYHKM